MLGGSRAAIGDGDSVLSWLGATDGAGMIVTTADGDGVRRCCEGDGDGGGGGVGLAAAVRVGVGSGGMTLLGELDAAAATVGELVAFGLAFGVGFAVADAFGVALGVGAAWGEAACADPMRSAGTMAMPAPASRTETRMPGTCEL
jgi:hypothetical protein